jgi:hypothetical protein
MKIDDTGGTGMTKDQGSDLRSYIDKAAQCARALFWAQLAVDKANVDLNTFILKLEHEPRDAAKDRPLIIRDTRFVS